MNYGDPNIEFPEDKPCLCYDDKSDKLNGFEQNFNDIDDYD